VGGLDGARAVGDISKNSQSDFQSRTKLVILPGIFIASFASILTFWVNVKKMQILQNTNNVFILAGFTIWYVVDLVFPILLSIVFIKLITGGV